MEEGTALLLSSREISVHQLDSTTEEGTALLLSSCEINDHQLDSTTEAETPTLCLRSTEVNNRRINQHKAATQAL